MAQSKYWIYPIKMVDLSIVFCMFTGGYHQLLIRIQPTRQRWPLCNPKKRGDVPQFRIPDWASIGPAWSFNMGPWHGLIKRNKPPGPRTSQDFTGLHGKIHGDDFFLEVPKSVSGPKNPSWHPEPPPPGPPGNLTEKGTLVVNHPSWLVAANRPSLNWPNPTYSVYSWAYNPLTGTYHSPVLQWQVEHVVPCNKS